MESYETVVEESVVAELLKNPDLYPEVCHLLQQDLFVSGLAAEVFFVIRCQWAENGDKDEIAIARIVRERGKFTSGQVLAMANERGVFASNSAYLVSRCIDELHQFRMVRNVRQVAEDILAAQTGHNVIELANSLQSVLEPPRTRANAILMSDSYHKVIDMVQDAIEGKSKAKGIPVGIPAIDRVTGGIRDGKMWIVCGETSDGKSMLVQNFAQSVAQASGKVAIYSWEMPDQDITARTIASVGNVSLGVFTGDVPLNRENQGKIADAARWMDEFGENITIINAADLPYADLMADIRLRVMRDQIKFVVIDYLQLIDLGELDKSREQQLAKGVSGLYRLVQSLGCGLAVLSQLNEDGKIRESRAPGFDADVILNIRKVYKEDETCDETRRNIFIEKNRGGRRGDTVPCLFQGEFARFVEMERRLVEAEEKEAQERRKPARGGKRSFGRH